MINDYVNLAKEKGNGQSNGKGPVYIVATPAFNEEKNIQSTIDSMISQIAQPKVWIIVDDGSSDSTWEIISSVAESHSWIRAYRFPKETNQGNDGLLVASEAAAFLDGLRIALEICPRPDFIVTNLCCNLRV